MYRLLVAAVLVVASMAMNLSADAAQRPAPRPFTGIGLLIARSAGPDGEAGPLPLYRRPGIDRVAEVRPSRLPGLETVLVTQPGEKGVVVMGVRGQWCRVIYDTADREGWLDKPRSWQFQPWEKFLKGRFVRFLPGLRKELAAVRQQAGDAAPELVTLSRGARLRVLRVEGDWAQALVETSRIGWLRWRDRDGRFLIAVE